MKKKPVVTTRPLKKLPAQPAVIIDTREQLPYEFPSAWPTIKQTMKTGDYSIAGWEAVFIVERKSLSDLLGCIFTNRFEREMNRCSSIANAYLVIESSLYGLLNAGRYKGNPRAVVGKLQAISLRYGVHVLFLNDRAMAQSYTQGLIEKYWRLMNQ